MSLRDHRPDTRSRRKRRNRNRKPKRECQIIHARRRAWQRLGVWWDKSDVEDISNKIKSGEAQFAEKETNRVTHWIGEHKGTRFRAVYDKKRHVVVTVW